jgi:hypothetical protein
MYLYTFFQFSWVQGFNNMLLKKVKNSSLPRPLCLLEKSQFLNFSEKARSRGKIRKKNLKKEVACGASGGQMTKISTGSV